MRRSLVALAVAGLLLTAACGDDDDGGEEAGGTATTAEEAGGAAGGSGSGEGEDFCSAYMDLAGQAVEGGASAQDAAEQLAALDAPAEIADAWDTLIAAGQGGDQMSPEVQAAATEVGQYVTEQCGESEPPAPSG